MFPTNSNRMMGGIMLLVCLSLLTTLSSGMAESLSNSAGYNSGDVGFISVQTSADRRQVVIRSGEVWVQETAVRGADGLSHILREITDGDQVVAAVYDGEERMKQCQIDQEFASIQNLMAKINDEVNAIRIDHAHTQRRLHQSDGAVDDNITEKLIKKLSSFLGNNSAVDTYNIQFDDISSLPPQIRRLADTDKMATHCRNLQASMEQRLDTFLSNESTPRHHRHRQERSTGIGIIYPGTLWCGPGDVANSPYALGTHTFTDRCCRAHDMCAPELQILGFQTKYYLHNKQMFTLSHCACDKRFHKCLRRVRNSISLQVGNTYFNVFHGDCFVIRKKRQCVDKGWWGKCNKYAKQNTAVLRKPSPFPSRRNIGKWKSKN